MCILCVSLVMTSEGKNKHYHRLCCYLPNTWVIKVTITLTLLRLQRQEYQRSWVLKRLLGWITFNCLRLHHNENEVWSTMLVNFEVPGDEVQVTSHVWLVLLYFIIFWQAAVKSAATTKTFSKIIFSTLWLLGEKQKQETNGRRLSSVPDAIKLFMLEIW